jgi:hypothetical protein
MLVQRQQFVANLEEEMRLHLEMRQQEQIECGMTAEGARAASLRRFGNPTVLVEESHRVWGLGMVRERRSGRELWCVRALMRSLGLTLSALLSLALGIGANTAIFSLIDTVILRSLPVEEPARLVLFGDGLDQGVSDGFPNAQLYSCPFCRECRSGIKFSPM